MWVDQLHFIQLGFCLPQAQAHTQARKACVFAAAAAAGTVAVAVALAVASTSIYQFRTIP